jgi:RNA polymerase-binding transcription factor DksA
LEEIPYRRYCLSKKTVATPTLSVRDGVALSVRRRLHGLPESLRRTGWFHDVELPKGREQSYQGSQLKLANRWYGLSLAFALRSECRFVLAGLKASNENWIKAMNKTNINGCRRILEAKRRELLSTHHETEGIAVQRVSDAMEGLSLEFQRHMAVDALNRKTAALCQVTEALERIAVGKYGLCLACQ